MLDLPGDLAATLYAELQELADRSALAIAMQLAGKLEPSPHEQARKHTGPPEKITPEPITVTHSGPGAAVPAVDLASNLRCD
jgi:hypothetical protein